MPGDALRVRVGTVDLPARSGWDRYFGILSYLELSGLFAAPVKTGTLSRWRAAAPPRSLGLIAPWPITHRRSPVARGWSGDDDCGEFRDSAATRAALSALAAAAERVEAAAVVFQAPADHSTSASSRETLQRFFADVAPATMFAGVHRVWIPGGLWERELALALAAESGVLCAIDPFVRAPDEPALEPLSGSIYLRPSGLGRSGPLSADRLDELRDLLADVELALVAFATGERLRDAINLAKLLESSPNP